jgi:hypothetical protein
VADPKPTPQECPECKGASIEFRGLGLDTQYKICSRYKEPGHLTWDEMQAKFSERLKMLRPSGRFA